MISILLPICEIQIEADPEQGQGTITSGLHETCPYCGQVWCEFSCDQSQYDDSLEGDEEEVKGRIAYNHMIDGIESLLLAMACAGIELNTPSMLEAIETAVEACGNNS